MTKLGPGVDRAEVERLIERVQETQSAFWDALGDLERETGLDLDGTLDYSSYTIDDLEDESEEEEG